ncbi:hypothetical protein B0H14DRAFT_2901720 [Mycena olivaceomarginata]|nr:hypothetical protein B0H14DRAFT_2901720 [Mycena olivaceomarginata]
MESGFIISPLTPPHIPDVLLCAVDTRSKIVTLVTALNSHITPVSARNVSRWLFIVARGVSYTRPVRPPAVYRRITVVGGDIFIRYLSEIGQETFPCDSPHPLPPGCYALFDPDCHPYQHPVGWPIARRTFAQSEHTWNVSENDPRAVFHTDKPVPEDLAVQAHERDLGLCCFTGRPSRCVTWVLPPLLSRAVHPSISIERCISPENVFTISEGLLEAYRSNQITVDPQDGYRVVAFDAFPGIRFLDSLNSPPSSRRFWRASLSWTLAARFAGCDAGKQGGAARARRLLEELELDSTLQGPEWSTPGGQEALRVFFWYRTGTEGCELTSPPSQSHSVSSSSSLMDGLFKWEEEHIGMRNMVRITLISWLICIYRVYLQILKLYDLLFC